MSDLEIKIPITTTGDTSGATKVEHALQGVALEAKKAEQAADLAEAKARVAARAAAAEGKGSSGGVGDDLLGKGVQKLGDVTGYGKEVAALRTAIGTDALAIGASFAAIGGAAVASYQLVSGTVKGYNDLFDDMKAHGEKVDPELKKLVGDMEASLGPLPGIIASVGAGWDKMVETVTHPIDTLTGLGDLKKSIEASRESMKKLEELRLKIANGDQANLSKIYNDEDAALKKQEATLKRIAGIRSELAALANAAAGQGVEDAKLRGGDVALAQSNELATKLATGLEGLNARLAQNSAELETARGAQDSAYKLYQEAIHDGIDKLDPKQFAKLSENVDKTQVAVRDLETSSDEQAAVVTASKTNLLRGVETELGNLEREQGTAISNGTKKANDEIYKSIKDNFASLNTTTGTALTAAGTAATTAINTKATEVGKTLTDTGKATIESLKTLVASSLPKPDELAAFKQSAETAKRSREEVNQEILKGFAALIASDQELRGKIQQLTIQVGQLYTRTN